MCLTCLSLGRRQPVRVQDRPGDMNRNSIRSLKPFLFEAVVYALLVLAYYFLVLHLLGDWLYDLFKRNVHGYTAVALALIIAQGVALEWITRFLLGLIRPWTEKQ